MMTNAEWNQQIAARHAEAVARGEHDEQCEYDIRGFYLCHCAKRRRKQRGATEPPAEELYFPPPTCPRCSQDLNFNDGWYCDSCALRWDESGANAQFTDEYGEDLAQRSAEWKTAQDARSAHNPKGPTT